MPKIQALAYAIAKRLPNVIIKEPERLFIGFISIIFGVIIISASTGRTPFWLLLSYLIWGIGFAVGGIAKIFSLIVITSPSYQTDLERIRLGRSVERLATSLIGLCTLIYVVRAANRGENYLVISIFAGLTLTNMVRLLVSIAGYVPLYRGRLND